MVVPESTAVALTAAVSLQSLCNNEDDRHILHKICTAPDETEQTRSWVNSKSRVTVVEDYEPFQKSARFIVILGGRFEKHKARRGRDGCREDRCYVMRIVEHLGWQEHDGPIG